MILYHITKEQYIPSISIHGLIPMKEKGMTGRFKNRCNCVWLTNDPSYIKETQLGDCWPDAVLLEIDVSGLDIKHYQITNHRGYECSILYELQYHGTIPPDRIRVLKNSISIKLISM